MSYAALLNQLSMPQGNSPFNFSNNGLQTGNISPSASIAQIGMPNQSMVSPIMMDNAQRNITDLNISNGNQLGFNMPTLSLGLQGLSALSGLYMGNRALGMAQDQFDFSKNMATKNLNNSVTAYNTGLEDRLKSRAQFSGDSSDAWKKDFERLQAKN